MSLSDQLSRNIATYEQIVQDLERRHLGEFALFSNGKLIEVYEARSDALKVGREKFGEGKFSVKQIGGSPLSQRIDTLSMNVALKRAIQLCRRLKTSSSITKHYTY